MKKILKNILKVSAFLAIAACLYVKADDILRLKKAVCVDQLYKLEKDTVDVLFVGSSHVYRNVDPSILYETEGITAYDLGTASQTFWNSYYLMVEALKVQHPKVIALDIYKAYLPDDYEDEGIASKATTSIHFSPNRIRAVNAAVSSLRSRLKYYLGLPMYHTRYNQLNIGDFRIGGNRALYRDFLGYMPLFKSRKGKGTQKLSEVTERTPVSEKNMKYLKMMMELCKKHDVEFMLIKTPYFKKSETYQKYYKYLEDFAGENNINFFYANDYFDEVGIDVKHDFASGSHLNHGGVKKYMPLLGTYLKEHYDLEDHRGDERYALWERNMAYIRSLENSDEDIEVDE